MSAITEIRRYRNQQHTRPATVRTRKTELHELWAEGVATAASVALASGVVWEVLRLVF